MSDTSTFKPDSDMLECIIDDKRQHAFFLKSFMEDYRNPMISSTSGNYFVYSGDIALLLLVSNKKVKFVSFLRIVSKNNYKAVVILSFIPHSKPLPFSIIDPTTCIIFLKLRFPGLVIIDLLVDRGPYFLI